MLLEPSRYRERIVGWAPRAHHHINATNRVGKGVPTLHPVIPAKAGTQTGRLNLLCQLRVEFSVKGRA